MIGGRERERTHQDPSRGKLSEALLSSVLQIEWGIGERYEQKKPIPLVVMQRFRNYLSYISNIKPAILPDCS